ncbi:hypothetical protein HYV84_04065 [Candidatus Woesearchaeota archaeon]|nr:hypothetical protein [Candidatus Woesearchaeota archaeon]
MTELIKKVSGKNFRESMDDLIAAGIPVEYFDRLAEWITSTLTRADISDFNRNYMGWAREQAMQASVRARMKEFAEAAEKMGVRVDKNVVQNTWFLMAPRGAYHSAPSSSTSSSKVVISFFSRADGRAIPTSKSGLAYAEEFFHYQYESKGAKGYESKEIDIADEALKNPLMRDEVRRWRRSVAHEFVGRSGAHAMVYNPNRPASLSWIEEWGPIRVSKELSDVTYGLQLQIDILKESLEGSISQQRIDELSKMIGESDAREVREFIEKLPEAEKNEMINKLQNDITKHLNHYNAYDKADMLISFVSKKGGRLNMEPLLNLDPDEIIKRFFVTPEGDWDLTGLVIHDAP